MAEIKALAWVLIGLVVFIWQMVRKARAATARDQRERPRRAVPLPTGSFEELLRQMQTQNQAPRPLPVEAARPARSLEQPLQPARSLEASSEPRSLEAPRREARRATSLPRAAQQKPTDYWSREVADSPLPAPAVAELLRNPANVRAAFVLSEVLNRRF